ncbi:MAG TPA: hypothetical protein VF841_02365 [Anaeromyxobacter sp.]
MLTCVHHVQWVRPVAGGLHQCILCQQIVRRSDVYPKLEDLTEEFRRRWDEHEKKAQGAGGPEGGGAPAKTPGETPR